MTSQKRAGGKKSQPSEKLRSWANGDKPAVKFLPPLKPRPKLVIALGILLALWLMALLVMRLTTIHPDTVHHNEPIPVLHQ